MAAPPIWAITVEQADRFVKGAGTIATGVAFGPASSAVRLVGPVGIASTAAFGTPIHNQLRPQGVAGAEAFGQTARALRSVGPQGIATVEAFGTAHPTLWVGPAGVASSVAFGTARALPLERPVGVASTAAVPTPSLTTVVAAQGIATGESFGSPTLNRVYAQGVPSQEAFGVVTVNEGATPAPVGGQGGFPFPLVRPQRPPQQPARRLVLAAGGIPSGELVASPLLRISAAPLPPLDYDPETLLTLRRIGRRQRRKIPVAGVPARTAAGTPGVWQLRPPTRPPIAVARVRGKMAQAEDEELLLLELA